MPHSVCADLNPEQQQQLLAIARRSIIHGLHQGRALKPDSSLVDAVLTEPGAVFVTLMRAQQLRGCIGALQAQEALFLAVANSAYNAAFRDRRFAGLQAAEVDEIHIEVSVLSPLEPMQTPSREVLLESLRPGVDGLLLEDMGYRSTFLPKVWDAIESPQAFLEALLQKAGLASDHWSETIRFQRYQTQNFAEN